MTDVMLTTYDNPFNPFTEFEKWFKEDILLGHHTCELLASESNTSSVLSDEVNDTLILEGIDRIIEMAPTIYRKVELSDYISTS